MRKNTKVLIIVGVFILLLVVAFLYFYVSGRTVANLFSEFENYEVTITKSSSQGVIDSETVLTSGQKEMLNNLFKETYYRRVVANIDEAENVDKVCLINHGKIAACCSPEEMRRSLLKQELILDAA